MAVLCNVMFASAQGSNTYNSTTVAQACTADELLQKRQQFSVLSFPDPKNSVRDSPTFSNTHVAELLGNKAGSKAEADLLKMYYDISALPLKKRRASFRSASPTDKSDLWRTHLALFLVKRQNLNEWQKAIILSAMALVTREYFEIRSGDALWKTKVRDPSSALEAQIVNAFSLEDAAKIFATLGDDADLAKSNASVLNKINYKPHSDAGPYKQWTLSKFAGQDIELERGACECSTESNYCPIWKANCSGGGCGWAQDGCGTFWSYPCNGVCR